MTTATVDKAKLITEYLAAVDAGDEEREEELGRLMPLTPSLAKSALRFLGKKELMAEFNLSEANEYFGEGWMDEPQKPFPY